MPGRRRLSRFQYYLAAALVGTLAAAVVLVSRTAMGVGPIPSSVPVAVASSTSTATMSAGPTETADPPTPQLVESQTPAGSRTATGPGSSSIAATPTSGVPRTPLPTATPAPTPTPPPTGWTTVINDGFNSGGLPSHWETYDGPYGSGPRNCAVPSHAVVSDGYLHLLMRYESSGGCGAGWYTAGVTLSGYSSVDQRVTVRFRVVRDGVAGHFIVPMRWPDDGYPWPAAGEEDFCETDSTSSCTTFLHYGAGNSQVYHDYSVDLSQWHTLVFQRSNHQVAAYIDGGLAWTFNGNATTLPDTPKHVVLQQECQSSCPSGTDGTEDIQIDWITVENPA